jgi:hypothetical protein
MGKRLARGGGIFHRGIPTMGLEETVDVGFAGELDIIAGLLDVNAIEFRGDAFIDKGDIFFIRLLESGADTLIEVVGDSRVGGGKEKIIYLAE